LSEILGRIGLSAVDLDDEGTACAATGAVKRDDEAIGCLVVDAEELLIVVELAVGLDVNMVETVLATEALAGSEPLATVAGGRELDGPLVDGLTAEVVVRSLAEAAAVVRGFTVSETVIVGALEVVEVDSAGRALPALEVTAPFRSDVVEGIG
jgi:hypothetical protein